MSYSLRTKIAFWLTIFTSSSFLIALLFYFNYSTQRESINKTIDEVKGIYLALLKCKNIQNDFFNIDIRNPEFYKYNSCQSLTVLDADYKKIRQKIATLKNEDLIKESNLYSDIIALEIMVNFNLATLDKIQQLLMLRGFKDEGVIGAMRYYAHQLESMPNVNMFNLLMLRRHEKDFIIRNDSLYVKKFNMLAASYRSDIQKYNAGLQNEALNSLKLYEDHFNLLVAIERVTGLKSNTGLKYDLDNIYHNIEARYHLFENNALELKSHIFRMLELSFGFFLLFVVGLCVWLGHKVASLLANPLKTITKQVSGIRKSNFDFVPKLNIDKPGKEIQVLYNEFNLMVDLLKQRESERDEAERTLRYNVAKYREMAEYLPLSIFEADIEGNITYCNKAFYEVLGYYKSEVKKGIKLERIFSQIDILHFFSNATFSDTQCTALRHDGDSVPIVVYVSQILKYGKISGIRGLIIDDSERRDYIHELELARKKAEESDRLKTAFLANMSHEIRTPMNAIIGFSNLLSDKNMIDKTGQEYLKYIKNSGEHLLKLIEDIIDLSRIESGELKIHYAPCSINQMLIELQSWFRQMIADKEKSIELTIYFGVPDENFSIVTDPFRLKQVLVNLISNAVKFTKNGYIEIGYDVFGDYLQFYVKDTGIGIPENKKDKIFERFNQAESIGNGGTGLGLTITKNIIQLLKGRIWVMSELGRGSVFYFTIPYEPVITNISVEEYYKIEGLSLFGKKILIVEDNDLNFILFEKILMHSGVKMLRAHNGKEAIAMSAKRVDLVLMDMHLPGISGYEATKIIKSRTPNVIVIAQTADVMSDSITRCFEAGCDDYISKPIDREVLHGKLGKWLKSGSKFIKPECLALT